MDDCSNRAAHCDGCDIIPMDPRGCATCRAETGDAGVYCLSCSTICTCCGETFCAEHLTEHRALYRVALFVTAASCL